MPLQQPWNDWYHCNGNTYGTWLPGVPRGFRTRHHREHVDGDYKKPPPSGKYDTRHQRAKEKLAQPPVYLSLEQRRVAVLSMADKLLRDQVELIALAVNDHHYHLLARFADRRPKHWIGRAKMHASMELRSFGLPGRVWAAGCRTLPITDGQHQANVFNYILKHIRQGAFVWTLHDPPPCNGPCKYKP